MDWLAGMLRSFFSWIEGLLYDGFQWIIDLVKTLLKTLWAMFGDLLCLLLEKILDMVTYILSGFEFDLSMFNLQSYFSALPPEVTNMIGLIGLSQALAIIITAIGIKIALQLVPFTRLGSA